MLIILRIVPVPAPGEPVGSKDLITDILMRNHVILFFVPVYVIVHIIVIPGGGSVRIRDIWILLRIDINGASQRMV